MNQLLLSSQRLDTGKILQTGSIDVFETLQKHGKLDILHLKTDFPKKALVLDWKEVKTPSTPSSFKDLVGKKLSNYPFQYLGQFKYDNKVLTPAKEVFASSFPNQSIQNDQVENNGWLNCTWLLDFLMNANKIQAEPLRKEFLIWSQESNNYILSLSVESADMRSAEQEKFLFSNNFSSIAWEHQTLFSK